MCQIRPVKEIELLLKINCYINRKLLPNASYELMFLRPYSFVVCLLLVAEVKVCGQIKEYHQEGFSDSTSLLKDQSFLSQDSLLKQTKRKYEKSFNDWAQELVTHSANDLKKSTKDSTVKSYFKGLLPGKPFLKIQNGYINYNYSYRSQLDTPFTENNIQQHLINIGANILVSQKFPFRIAVYERRTNSAYFKNYTDLRVEFNAPEFRRIQSKRLEKYFENLTSQLQPPQLKSEINTKQRKLIELKSFLNKPELIKKFLQSKETIINEDELTGSAEHKDSTIKEATEFIELYERNQKDIKSVEHSYDSLRNEYVSLTKEILQLRQIFKSNVTFPGGSEKITEALNKAGLQDKQFERLLRGLYSVRTFALGRTAPNYTNLTVQNIGVNGVNTEINNNNFYAAFVAGLIDFRLRDFVLNKYKTQSQHQYVTAARIGWGRKDGNHIILTGYQGRKQIFSSQSSYNTIPIFGLSLESQFVLSRNIRFIAEIAQSAIGQSKGIIVDSLEKRFSLKDNNSRALSLQAFSYFPRTYTRIEGGYEYQGINFQSFNAYKPNASTNTWSIRADQYFLHGIIHLTAAINKNDYVNPLITQNYSSNTIFTTANATIRKRLWPVISFGYVPSSQYSIINNQIFESRYEAFNVTMNHVYKLGIVNASSSVMFNRFYNSGKDTGFVYYNAQNLTINQNIIFEKFSTNIGISHTQNSQYLLDIMSAGITKTILKNNSVGFGIKLNHINAEENKFGYFINTRINIKKIGILNIWGERGYLPGLGNNLIKNEFFNIGFTRYFN